MDTQAAVETKKKYNFEVYKADSRDTLKKLEKQWRNRKFTEFIPPALNTPFTEVAEKALPDKEGGYTNPFYYYITMHPTSKRMRDMGRKAEEWFIKEGKGKKFDVLSISSGIEDNRLKVKTLIRAYDNLLPDIRLFFQEVGEEYEQAEIEDTGVTGYLIIPDEIKNFRYTDEQVDRHNRAVKEQQGAFENCSYEKPFLNQLDHYEPKKLKNPADSIDLVYDLLSADMNVQTLTKYENFMDVFREIIDYVNGTEFHTYAQVITGEHPKEEFMSSLKTYLTQKFVEDSFNGHHIEAEDMPYMMAKIYNALFELYVVQPLIDNPEVTDVKITAPDSIRARIKGKAYMSNIHFLDNQDYLRFVQMICLRNRVSQNVPAQTFTDNTDPNYALRMSLTSEFVNSVACPYLHIRKVDRHKMMADDLIAAGMFDEKIKDYILDCGKNSNGVVFGGPPGSGKTIVLNWFLEEAYEQSAEILVIQENDELYTYRKGVMIEHVVPYPTKSKPAVTLEQLGQLALVAGANVFVIGEAKGAEICSAITLSNSGCRTALTLHTKSSTEIPEKMADLAMRGIYTDYRQAKRALKSFQTLVYLQDFKVQEISEITGYNEQKGDLEYRYIYRREME